MFSTYIVIISLVFETSLWNTAYITGITLMFTNNREAIMCMSGSTSKNFQQFIHLYKHKRNIQNINSVKIRERAWPLVGWYCLFLVRRWKRLRYIIRFRDFLSVSGCRGSVRDFDFSVYWDNNLFSATTIIYLYIRVFAQHFKTLNRKFLYRLMQWAWQPMNFMWQHIGMSNIKFKFKA